MKAQNTFIDFKDVLKRFKRIFGNIHMCIVHIEIAESSWYVFRQRYECHKRQKRQSAANLWRGICVRTDEASTSLSIEY